MAEYWQQLLGVQLAPARSDFIGGGGVALAAAMLVIVAVRCW